MTSYNLLDRNCLTYGNFSFAFASDNFTSSNMMFSLFLQLENVEWAAKLLCFRIKIIIILSPLPHNPKTWVPYLLAG